MADLFKEILPDINYGHKNLIRTGEMDEGEYGGKSFIINRALSMNVDTVLYYDYFINSLRKKKRWSKWAKAQQSTNLDVVKTYYNYNEQRAREALELLTEKQVEGIRLRLSKGGTNNETTRKTK